MQVRNGKRVPGPRHDLAAFQAEVRKGNVHVYATRARDIIQRLRNCGRAEAIRYATNVALSLELGDYSETLEMVNGQVMDVYGTLVQVEGWYVKIEINMDDNQPGIVSCHPAKYDIKTQVGKVPRSSRGADL